MRPSQARDTDLLTARDQTHQHAFFSLTTGPLLLREPQSETQTPYVYRTL